MIPIQLTPGSSAFPIAHTVIYFPGFFKTSPTAVYTTTSKLTAQLLFLETITWDHKDSSE